VVLVPSLATEPDRLRFASPLACESEPNWLNDYDAQADAEMHAAATDEEMQQEILDELEAEAANHEPVEAEFIRPGNGSGNGHADAGSAEAKGEKKQESKEEKKQESKEEKKQESKEEKKQESKEEKKQEPPIHLHVVKVADVEAKKYNWLWPSRIARGKVTLFVGMPDVNKSTLALDLASRITNGEVLPNSEGRAPCGTVIILSAEDDVADTMRPRLEVAGANLDKVYAITAAKVDKKGGRRIFDLTRDIAQLELLVKVTGDVVAIIIDPYSAYMGKPGKLDSFRSTDVRATLAPLFDMASRLDVAVIGIGHLNKSGSMPALMRVLDSVAFVAASRGVYLIVRDPEDDERRLFLPAKNNIGRIRSGLAFKVVEKLATTVFDSYPCIRWEDEAVDMTADEALAWREDGRRSETKEHAKALLRQVLANGPVKQGGPGQGGRTGHQPEDLEDGEEGHRGEVGPGRWRLVVEAAEA
jgi:AAA domain